jgi:signal transduction histidine kinase
MEQLSQARSLDDVIELLRRTARRVVGADGIAVVLREGDTCHYVAEDAEEPLWQGQRFPADICVSGWAMMHRETVVIPDIADDPRVPYQAYKSTFVRSILMVPIGAVEPVAAVGAYWATTHEPNSDEIALLEALARGAATALENGRLLSALEALGADLERRVVERTVELERAQQSLRQTQKMEIIGQLTGNVAHDFNNLLSPIMSSLDMVLVGRAAPEVLSRSAMVAMEAAETAKTLIQRLLAFARRQPLIPTVLDLRPLIEGMRGLLQSTVGTRIGVEISVADGLPAIRADRHQLEMAILNLTVNARDAMPAGGMVRISATRSGADTPDTLPPGEFIRLAIRDEGVGMDARTLASATEPFFTTKAVGHGTGLGLSMVDGLVNQMGGALAISSEPGRGTEVILWLPLARRESAARPDSGSPTRSSVGRAELLLIEDDPLVRIGTSDMLRDLGFTVRELESARDGLALIEGGYRPDIVVTDHIMPGMTGAELALRLRSDHPDIAILIVSGYQGIDLIAPDIVRLSKPFRQAHLRASIVAAFAQNKVEMELV